MSAPITPPRFARWLLHRALAGPARSAIVGDIEEEFAGFIAPTFGARRARRWYWRQTVLSIAACILDPWASDPPRPKTTKAPHMPLRRRLDEMREDVVFAVRQLRRSPMFTVVAAATLALGIGANGAIFALVDATLLRPLPVREPDRLVAIWERSTASERGRVSPLNMLDWTRRTRTFDSIAGYVPRVGAMVMNGRDGASENVSRQWVTAGFFDAIGARVLAGRTFTADDNARDAEVVVLSEAFWRARFAGDPAVVGRPLRLDGGTYTVVGVVAQGAEMLGRTSIWALLSINAKDDTRGAYFLQAIGRMKPGVTVDAARADLSAAAETLARDYPATNAGRGVTLQPLHDALIGSELWLTSMLFLGVVGFVLLLCCANVANLLLARTTVRARELAIRAALGAGRARVVRQLLTESLVLSAIGGTLGLGVGAAIITVATPLIPRGLMPPALTLAVDLRVAAFCAAAALLVGLLFGLAPAWQATSPATGAGLASDRRTTTGRGGRLRGVLVAGEVATAVLLLVGAGLLLRTLLAVEGADRGYRAKQVLTMMVDPLSSQYPTAESLLRFIDDVEGEVYGVPGVARVAWTSQLPYAGTRERAANMFVEIVGDPLPAESQRPAADRQMVSPSYFETLDLPLVAGRAFSDRDTTKGPPVCIVNEAFARRYLGSRSPIGMRIALRPMSNAGGTPVVREIVGVARQVRSRPDETEPLVVVYVPMAQNVVGDVYLLVRPASGPADALVSGVRAAIGRIDREQLVSVRDILTIEDLAWIAAERHRFRAVMVTTFAGLALALAMVGVFGIVGYAVEQRLRELAVRRALGATTADVLRLVAGRIAPLFAAGLAVGLALAAALGRTLATVLVGVDPLDPLAFAGAAGVLSLVGLLATAGPARRALRIDPATALRGL